MALSHPSCLNSNVSFSVRPPLTFPAKVTILVTLLCYAVLLFPIALILFIYSANIFRVPTMGHSLLRGLRIMQQRKGIHSCCLRTYIMKLFGFICLIFTIVLQEFELQESKDLVLFSTLQPDSRIVPTNGAQTLLNEWTRSVRVFKTVSIPLLHWLTRI